MSLEGRKAIADYLEQPGTGLDCPEGFSSAAHHPLLRVVSCSSPGFDDVAEEIDQAVSVVVKRELLPLTSPVVPHLRHPLRVAQLLL